MNSQTVVWSKGEENSLHLTKAVLQCAEDHRKRERENHGWMLHVCGREGEAEDKPGDRQTTEERQERLPERTQAAAAG